MKSIFEIENRLDIPKEFSKLVDIFQEDPNATIYEEKYHSRTYGTFMSAVNKTVFLEWKYRDTFLDVYEYLEHIGINIDAIEYLNYHINQEQFLYYLEFVLNMVLLIDNTNKRKIELLPITIAAIENIPKILEKMNYKIKELDDKIIITKRNADIDSILETVPKDIASTLLEYNDFRIQDDIKAKQKILKNIDLYIEKNINIKYFDKELDNAIGTIVNKMGINHPIKEEPYKSFTDEQLIEWYDKCFLMMIHAIRTVGINKIKNERKKLAQK